MKEFEKFERMVGSKKLPREQLAKVFIDSDEKTKSAIYNLDYIDQKA